MREVRKAVPRKKAAKQAMRGVRRAGASDVSSDLHAPLAAAPQMRGGARAARQAEGIAAALAVVPQGEGSLLTLIGNPRSGKTHVALQLVARARREGQLVLVHDPKSPSEYQGIEMAGPWDLRDPTDGETIDVHRSTGAVSPEDLAQTALTAARRGQRACLVADEGVHVLRARQSFGPWWQRCYSEGQSQGLTTIMLSQRPQWLPGEALDFGVALIFPCRGRALRYLAGYWPDEPEMISAIGRLRPGQFVLASPYDDWNRTIYGRD